MARRISVFLLWIITPTALAASTGDEGSCRNGTFGVENEVVGLADIHGSGRSFFLDDTQDCPSIAPECRLKAYLVGGDRVITGRSRGEYICVYFPSKGGGTAGWMKSSRLKALPVQADPPLSAWVGHWSDAGNPRVRFYMQDGTLAVEGQAAWPSFNPSAKQFPGGPNVGDISETVRTAGRRAFAKECGVSFTLVGDFLVAADPKMQCGGMNVSFSGVYRRSRP